MIPSEIVGVDGDMLKFIVTDQPPPEPYELSVNWCDTEQISQGYSDPYSKPKVGERPVLALSEGYCDQNAIPKVERTKEPRYLAAGAPGEWFVVPPSPIKRLELTISNDRTINLRDPGFVKPGSVHIDEDGNISMSISKAAAAQLGLPGLADSHEKFGE
jgi:hypothetical protein